MKIPFYKYHGTGNDFVLIDNRLSFFKGELPPRTWIAHCCRRRFGIGADGMILLQPHPQADFEMIYFNADGGVGSMCGNGGRCVVAFAHHLGIIGNETRFLGNDGEHRALIRANGTIDLKMQDVIGVEQMESNTYFLQTGSPHYVEIVENLDEVPIVEWGRAIRNNDRFKKEGTNVNFMQLDAHQPKVATYERGVEDETYSCGTGAVAAAIVHNIATRSQTPETQLDLTTKGGQLTVRFQHHQNHHFHDIWLCGSAEKVFEGIIEYPF